MKRVSWDGVGGLGGMRMEGRGKTRRLVGGMSGWGDVGECCFFIDTRGPERFTLCRHAALPVLCVCVCVCVCGVVGVGERGRGRVWVGGGGCISYGGWWWGRKKEK